MRAARAARLFFPDSANRGIVFGVDVVVAVVVS